MARNLDDVRTVDYEFVLGDTNRQQLANPLPGNRVEVLPICNVTLGVHSSVENLGAIVGVCGQRQQVWTLFLIEVDGASLGFSVRMDVRDVSHPPVGDLVEMIERSEGPCIKQVGFHEKKWPLNFPLCLRPAASTSPGPKAVVGGKGQKASVVNRLLAIPGLHHNFHVVIETRGG